MNSLRNHAVCYNLALHSTILMHPRDSNTCRTYELLIKYIRELYVESRWFRNSDRTAQVIRGRLLSWFLKLLAVILNPHNSLTTYDLR